MRACMKVARAKACIKAKAVDKPAKKRQPALTFPDGNMTHRKQFASKRPISPVTSDDGLRPTKSIRKIPVPSYAPFIDPVYATPSPPATSSCDPTPDTLQMSVDAIPETQPLESSEENDLPLSFRDPLYGIFATPTLTTNAAERAAEAEARGLAAAEQLEAFGLNRLFEDISSTLLTSIMGLDDKLVVALLGKQGPESLDNVIRELAAHHTVCSLDPEIKAVLFLRTSKEVFRQIWVDLDQKERHGAITGLLKKDMELLLSRLLDLE
jgi:hypothetical protein